MELIHLERFLPLGALMEHCSLVLFHGGSGTLGHALAHGLPMVILPLGADQPENAVRCSELGASRTLGQDSLTPHPVREVVLDVFQRPSYRRLKISATSSTPCRVPSSPLNYWRGSLGTEPRSSPHVEEGRSRDCSACPGS